MEKIHLQCSSGNARADATAEAVIRIYESAFPRQIAGYYLEGSYADQTNLATSDLDIVLVLRQPIAEQQTLETVRQLWDEQPHQETLEVDLIIISEQELQRGVSPTLKIGSTFLYGEDICRSYPLLPIEEWTRKRMHAAYWLMIEVYQRTRPVTFPLAYPEADDEFYGYTKRLFTLPDGTIMPCTRNIVRTTGWAATALLAYQRGQYVVRKRDCARLYRETIGDEWALLLDSINVFCREKWQYLLPAGATERQHLQAICQQILRFEQHFLNIYRLYLLEQLRSTSQEHVQHALWTQQQIPLVDEQVALARRAASIEQTT